MNTCTYCYKCAWMQPFCSRQCIYKCSLSKVLPVCSSVHSPAPISDTALTLTVYSVPAFNPVRIVELGGGEPDSTSEAASFQDVVPVLLYSTWYWEMVRSLWGVVQATIRTGAWDSTVLVNVTSLTLEGAVQEVKTKAFLYSYQCMQWVSFKGRCVRHSTCTQEDDTYVEKKWHILLKSNIIIFNTNAANVCIHNSRSCIPKNILCSLLNVLSVCTSLHSPSPAADTALTLTSYSVPASSAGSLVEFAGGEPEIVTWLPHTVDRFLLNCTWYSEMVALLCGAVQVTFRVGLPWVTSFVRETPETWEVVFRSRVAGNHGKKTYLCM